MLQPLLYSLQMIIRVDIEPFVAYIAKNTRHIKFSNIWIFGEYRIEFIQYRAVFAIDDAIKMD